MGSDHEAKVSPTLSTHTVTNHGWTELKRGSFGDVYKGSLQFHMLINAADSGVMQYRCVFKVNCNVNLITLYRFNCWH